MQLGIHPADLLPHGADMVLLDAVLCCDEQSLTASSARHQQPYHPLAWAAATGGLDAVGRIAAVHLLEYAAQAAALHIGLMQSRDAAAAQSTPVPGVLAYVRELQLACAHIAHDDPLLHIEVRRKARIPGGFAYAFSACAAERVLATGVFGVLLAAAGARQTTGGSPE